MIKIPELFKGTENFWKINSEYVIVFEDFYNKDKSKDKEKSSKIMWALYFKLHPDSVFYNLPDKDNVIIERFLKEPKFKWKQYEDIEIEFKNTILTQAERSLYEWDEFMKKRDKYLKNTEYYFDQYKIDENGDNIFSKTGNPVLVKGTAEQLDKALTTTPKIFMDYGKIRKELQEEKLKRGKGNKPLSASDANLI